MIALLLALHVAFAGSRVDRLVEKAQQANDKGDFAASFARCDKALHLDPENVSAHFLRATAMLSIVSAVPNPDDQAQILAAVAADMAFVAAREPATIRGGIARDYLARSGPTRAFALPEPRYACSPEAEHALAAAEALARRAPKEADEAYTQALALCPTNALWWTWYGDLYFGQSNYDRAAELYSRGLRIDPLLAPAWRYRADARAAQGQSDPARQDLLHAIAADPTYEAAWAALSALAAVRGEAVRRPRLPPVSLDPKTGELRIDQVGAAAIPAGDLAATIVFTLLDSGAPLPAGMKAPASLPDPKAPPIQRRRAALRLALDVFLAGEARPQTPFWQLAAAAQAADQLDPFLFTFLLDESVAAEFLLWRVDHHDEHVRFLDALVSPQHDPR